MRNHTCRWLGIAVLILFSSWVRADERLILRTSPERFADLVARHGLKVLLSPDNHGVSVVSSKEPGAKDAIQTELKSDSDDGAVESDSRLQLPEMHDSSRLNQPTGTLSDALNLSSFVSYFGGSVWSSYANQSAAQITRLHDAQQYFATGTGIVAIIDTGVDPNHPVLSASLVPGYDFVRDIPGSTSELADLDQSTAAILDQSTAAILDESRLFMVNPSTGALLNQSTAAILDGRAFPPSFGHGTLIAGIVHLVAPTARIMPLKAFQADGTATLSNLVRAIYYAVDHGAEVINMSFSLDEPSPELTKAINYATANDVICVASAGNDGQETIVFPAAFHGVIGVAASNSNDQRSTFSNYGAAVAQLAAPGENVITTFPGGGYAVVSGTSFAAPFIAGGASLMLQLNSYLSPVDVVYAFSKQKKLTPDIGFGRIDFYSALRAVPHRDDR